VKEAFRRHGGRVRGAHVPQPDRGRLRAVQGRQSAEVLRRAGRVGEGQSRPLRLQRHQGRGERRRLHHGLGVLEDRTLQGAHQGPFDRGKEPAIREAITALRDFNKQATITNGNAGTLDALNRGEIWMGAVWIDQLVAWKNEGAWIRRDAGAARAGAADLSALPGWCRARRPAGTRRCATSTTSRRPRCRQGDRWSGSAGIRGVDPEKVLPLINARAASCSSAERERAGSRPFTRARCRSRSTRPDQPGLRGESSADPGRALAVGALCAPALAVLAAVFSGRSGPRWWRASRARAVDAGELRTVANLYAARRGLHHRGRRGRGPRFTFRARRDPGVCAAPPRAFARWSPAESRSSCPSWWWATRSRVLEPVRAVVSSSWAGIATAARWKHLGLAALLLLGAFRGPTIRTSRPRASSAPPPRLTRDILVPMAAPALAVTGILIFSSMLARSRSRS